MSAEKIISVDAMGGDNGPAPLIAGLSRAAKDDESLRFLLHGDETALKKQLRRRRILRDRVSIHHAPDVIAMDEKPSRALRTGRNSSLWSSLQSVSNGDAKVAMSAGNTGAIVALATLALRKAPGIHRPAIAVHWPANNESGFNVVLDMGADIRADAGSLVQYAIMGAEYSRLAIGHAIPRVGLLNIGSEDTKGRPELHEAKAMLDELSLHDAAGLSFVGFVEGTDILSDRVDVIVTDGFTGNIALKAAEGTAAFIRKSLKDAFAHSILSRFGALFALTSLRRLRQKIDPRRVNGGVFLGLNGSAVKSHGSADPVGHASAVHLAAKIAVNDFPSLIAERLAKTQIGGLSGDQENSFGVGSS